MPTIMDYVYLPLWISTIMNTHHYGLAMNTHHYGLAIIISAITDTVHSGHAQSRTWTQDPLSSLGLTNGRY